MKIIGICGSPRKKLSRTGQLVREVLAGAQSVGADTECIDLSALKIDYCTGCGRCHHTGMCSQKDDFNPLFEKILVADGLVLGSPVYISHVTALLKNWIDHLGNTIHCMRLFGKYGAVVCTTAGSGLKETGNYLEWLLRRAGAQSVGGVGYRLADGLIPEGDDPLCEAKSLGITLANAVKDKTEFPEQLKEHEVERQFFSLVVTSRLDEWDWEYRYWKEKGWLQFKPEYTNLFKDHG
jgi:multimeric flavodoxin WrbA